MGLVPRTQLERDAEKFAEYLRLLEILGVKAHRLQLGPPVWSMMGALHRG